MFKAWTQGILEARCLLPTAPLWAHEPTRHNEDMYRDLPQAILNPTSLRHKLGILTPAEWSSLPGLYKKQIPNKARTLARLNTEILLHSQ